MCALATSATPTPPSIVCTSMYSGIAVSSNVGGRARREDATDARNPDGSGGTPQVGTAPPHLPHAPSAPAEGSGGVGDQPETDGLAGRHLARGHPELAQHGRDVVVDRLHRDHQLGRDLVVAAALDQQDEHLVLAG